MHRILRSLIIPVLTLALLWGSSGRAVCPEGDLSEDCKIGFDDLRIFADQWLGQGACGTPDCADLDMVDGINMFDFSLLTRNWGLVGHPIVINEFMASNGRSFQDPQGDYDDWLEIYNAGDEPIDVGGMYVTDDMNKPTKWRIPNNTTIAAHDHLLIWTDNDTGDSPGLHADFQLGAKGGEIALFDGNGTTLVDSVFYDRQTSDISYGRYPDGGVNWRFLGSPTADAQNKGAYLGVVEAPQFSHKRGFYDSSFLLTIGADTEGARVYYTLDGVDPYTRQGRFLVGTLYKNPIPVGATMTLRARAVKTGWMSSRTVTHTYIFGASNAIKSLPIISLVEKADTTFYDRTGIMAIIGGTRNSGVWVSSGPGSYNNPMQRGMAYERPVSFEWFNADDGKDFQMNCGIRVHGSSWMRPRYRDDNDPDVNCKGVWSGDCKFSFRLYFRGLYGENRMEKDIFPYGLDRHKSIVLRGGHNDRTNPFIKDELLRRLHMDMGNAASMGTNANLFINGEYKGYFNPCEHIKNAFCQEYYKSNEEFDVMTMNGMRDGDSRSWDEMISYGNGHALSNGVYYLEMTKRLDMAAFADYLILQLWCGNWDWPQNNWAAASERTERGRWRFFIWDAEGGMFSNRLNSVRFNELNSQNNGNGWLYRALKVNKTFRTIFCDRIYKHFYNNGAMTAANIRYRFDELRDQMSGEIPNMSMYVVNTWVPNRLGIFLNACIGQGMFTSVGPTLRINGVSRYGGYISAGNALSITSQIGGNIYYTLDGTDPRVSEGDATPGNAVTLVPETAAKRILVPTGPLSPPANAWATAYFDDSSWQALSSGTRGVGYERRPGDAVNYASLIDADVEAQMYDKQTTCYIRIPFNVSSLDIMQLTLNIKYDDGFVAFINGSEVTRRNFTQSPEWDSKASTSQSDQQAVNFEPIDISEHINRLQIGQNVLAIQGLNVGTTSSDFVVSAELIARKAVVTPAGGVSPTAVRYTSARTLSKTTEVKARIYSGGTWSALSQAVFAIGPVAGNLRITEIMYHPAETGDPQDPNNEFIELRNIGPGTINLNLVRFTNGIDFTFADVYLQAAENLVIVRNVAAFSAEYPGFAGYVAGEYTGSLNNGGERIELVDAMGQTIQNFKYNDGWRSLTDGRGYSLTIIDPANPDPNSWDEKDGWRASAYFRGSPGNDDSGIIPNPGAIVINEVLAHSHAEAPDWIEFYNTTGEEIDISGWYLSDNDVNAMKYKFADGTKIGAGEYLVLREDNNFGEMSIDPGRLIGFAFSENGDEAYLSSGEAGVVTGYRAVEDFGASVTGVSFGRYLKKSTGSTNFVPMSVPTPAARNAYPEVGPIVINEIMYNPVWSASGSYTNNQYEYIELYNAGPVPAKLFDDDTSKPWKFTNGIDYTFPPAPGINIPSGGYLLVSKNPTAHLSRYGLPRMGVLLLGPYLGKLSDAGEKLELSMPGDVDDLGVRHYIRVDRVVYSDGAHPQNEPGGVDLWPVEPDEGGASLNRIATDRYANDPNNWTAAAPTPGY